VMDVLKGNAALKDKIKRVFIRK